MVQSERPGGEDNPEHDRASVAPETGRDVMKRQGSAMQPTPSRMRDGEDTETGRLAAIDIEDVMKRSLRGIGYVHERGLRPYRAKKRIGRLTQGGACGLALPWANEWLRLWREERK